MKRFLGAPKAPFFKKYFKHDQNLRNVIVFRPFGSFAGLVQHLKGLSEDFLEALLSSQCLYDSVIPPPRTELASQTASP